VPLGRDTLQALRDTARRETVPVRVEGTCMHPALDPGAVVLVRAARLYWPGDVVVFAAPAGDLTVHRVIGWGPASWTRPWRNWAVWAQADGAATPDSPIAPDRLLGRVPGRPGIGVRVSAALRLLGHLARRVQSRVRAAEDPSTGNA